jgi:hypothetical protein
LLAPSVCSDRYDALGERDEVMPPSAKGFASANTVA